MTRQRLHDAALALPALGTLLIMPPFVLVLVDAADLGGIPAIVLYLFGVWVALIVAGFRLSRRLGALADPEPDSDQPDMPAGQRPDADR